MQTKINKVRDQVVTKLNELGIEFSVEDIEITKDNLSTKLTGYKIVSDNLMGCIVPNFANKRPEYLIFNEKLASHLASEGYDDAHIQKHGKIWIHLFKAFRFVELFKQSHSI
jgi:hypothetical protein